MSVVEREPVDEYALPEFNGMPDEILAWEYSKSQVREAYESGGTYELAPQLPWIVGEIPPDELEIFKNLDGMRDDLKNGGVMWRADDDAVAREMPRTLSIIENDFATICEEGDFKRGRFELERTFVKSGTSPRQSDLHFDYPPHNLLDLETVIYFFGIGLTTLIYPGQLPVFRVNQEKGRLDVNLALLDQSVQLIPCPEGAIMRMHGTVLHTSPTAVEDVMRGFGRVKYLPRLGQITQAA